MKLLSQRIVLLLLAFVSVLFYLIGLSIVKNDSAYVVQHYALYWYLGSIATIVIPLFAREFLRKRIHRYGWDLVLLFILFCASLVLFFGYLRMYPFPAFGDELRDAGLSAVNLMQRTIQSYFDYGDYAGFGRIISVYAIAFYKFFGPSVFAFRVYAAVIGILDILLFYIVLRLHFTKSVAFITALSLAVSPLHMLFARTEVVVMFNAFWTTALLLTFALLLRKTTLSRYILLGLVMGIASQYHTPSRIVALCIGFLACWNELFLLKQTNFKQKFSHLTFLLVFFLVGFGPMLLYSRSNTFLQSARFRVMHIEEDKTIGARIDATKKIYLKSLMSIVYEPVLGRNQFYQPFLPSIHALLFVLGIGYTLFVVRNYFFTALLFMVLVIPFTNSTMTDAYNQDYRLLPLLPIALIFVASGLTGLQKKVLHPFGITVLYLVLITYASIASLYFFRSLDATKSHRLKDFVAMHTIYTLQTQPKASYCLYVSEENYIAFDLIHHKEQFRYFLPGYQIEPRANAHVGHNSVYIAQGECTDTLPSTTQEKIEVCNGTSFTCPKDYIDTISIYY